MAKSAKKQQWTDVSNEMELKELSTDSPKERNVLPPSSSPALSPDLPDEILNAQKVLLQEERALRASRISDDTLIKHIYNASSTNPLIRSVNYTRNLNAIAAGTAANNRTSFGIINHSCTLRFNFMRVESSVTGETNPSLIWNPGVRIVVWRFKKPVTSTFCPVDTNPPTDPNSPYTGLGQANPDYLTVPRNPNSFDNVHVYYDEVHHLPVSIASSGAADAYAISGSMAHKIYVDFHRCRSQYYDATAGSLVENQIWVTVMTDAVQTVFPIQMSLQTDFVFSDGPQD